MTISSAGLVGIGNTAPSTKLQLTGSADSIIRLEDTATIGAVNRKVGGIEFYQNDASGGAGIGSSIAAHHVNISGDTDLRFATGDNTERMRITSAGNVGIGTTAPVARFVVSTGGADLKIMLTNEAGLNKIKSTTSDQATYSSLRYDATDHIFESSDSEKVRITSTGRVGIGISSPATKFHVLDGTSSLRFRQNGTVSETLVVGPSGGDAALYFGDTVDTVRGGLYYDTSANEFQVRGYNNNIRMTVSSAGTVNVVGTFTAGTKTFRIDHPLPEKTDTHYLLHSSIEGPQADLIYRGRADLVSGVATVNIDTVSNMTEGTFDILCGDVQCFTSNEDGWTALKGSVTGNVLTITAQDNTCTDTVSWMVIGERKDAKMIESEWADNDGKLIVETLKNEH